MAKNFTSVPLGPISYRVYALVLCPGGIPLGADRWDANNVLSAYGLGTGCVNGQMSVAEATGTVCGDWSVPRRVVVWLDSK